MESFRNRSVSMSPVAKLRNIGVAAHIDAGKTTLSERFLYYTGVERRMGEVRDGTAVMDWMDEERRRGITISSAVTTMPWRGHQINLIDTPGHVDFTVEVERCMRVLDGGVLVIAGPSGVQPQSETVWRQMQRHGVPCLAFLNQWDRPGCRETEVLEQMRSRLALNPILLQVPVGSGVDFTGVVDLIEMRAWRFDGAHPEALPIAVPLDEDQALEAGVMRSELVDQVAELDDELADVVLAGREPGPGQLAAAVRRLVLRRVAVPVFFGSALYNIGMQLLLDAIVDYLPSPLDRGAVQGRRVLEGHVLGERVDVHADASGDMAALVFKLAADPKEDLFFARIYAGELRVGMPVWNARTGSAGEIEALYRMHADHREALVSAGPGDLVALAGLKATRTGDTLTTKVRPIALARLSFPAPVMMRTVEPEAEGDRDALALALGRLEFEDPTFRKREDRETGQWLVSGMGELHLEVALQRIRDDFGLEVHVGNPRVAYREVVGNSSRGEATVDRPEDGPGGQAGFGQVALELMSCGGDGSQVVWAADCEVPQAFRPSIEAALASAARAGGRFGFPLEGLRVEVYGGRSRPGEDVEVCFVQAAGQAFSGALSAAEIGLQEPLMRFSITCPDEFAGGVMADLNALGAEISEVESEGLLRVLRGEVALVAMFGFSTALRSRSQGRGTLALELGGFRLLSGIDLASRGLSWS